MNRDLAPVIAAQALVAHGMRDDAVIAYLRRTWHLDSVDAQAAVSAARTLAGHGRGVGVAAPRPR